MKFYIAGSLKNDSEIKKHIQAVKDQGHEISFDWTLHEAVKPYGEHVILAQEYAEKALEGARSCHIFVLIPDQEGGTTQFAELGVAIFSDEVKKIFIVGPHNARSLAFFHPRVMRVESFDEVFVS